MRRCDDWREVAETYRDRDVDKIKQRLEEEAHRMRLFAFVLSLQREALKEGVIEGAIVAHRQAHKRLVSYLRATLNDPIASEFLACAMVGAHGNAAVLTKEAQYNAAVVTTEARYLADLVGRIEQRHVRVKTVTSGVGSD